MTTWEGGRRHVGLVTLRAQRFFSGFIWTATVPDDAMGGHAVIAHGKVQTEAQAMAAADAWALEKVQAMAVAMGIKDGT